MSLSSVWDNSFDEINDALNKMLKRENRIGLYHQCLKFLNTRVSLDLECFPDDIWSHWWKRINLKKLLKKLFWVK